jgi:hypothetical protein
MEHEDDENGPSTLLSCGACTKPCVLRETLDDLKGGLITGEQAVLGRSTMHDTRIVMKSGETLEAPIWEWRPAEGYFTLVGHERTIYLRDVASAVTPGQRSLMGPIDQDELVRAREMAGMAPDGAPRDQNSPVTRILGMTDTRREFLEALAAFTEAAERLRNAWAAEDVPDDVGNPEYPFGVDFNEVPSVLYDWREAIETEFATPSPQEGP